MSVSFSDEKLKSQKVSMNSSILNQRNKSDGTSISTQHQQLLNQLQSTPNTNTRIAIANDYHQTSDDHLRQQQKQQQQSRTHLNTYNRHNTHPSSMHTTSNGTLPEFDRMSVGSININDDLNSKARRPSFNDQSQLQTLQVPPQQRRTSFLRKQWQQHTDVPFVIGADINVTPGGFCEKVLTSFSWFLLILFMPFSLFFTLKVVQEYERAVIFRLGRLLPGGAKGPGMFLVLPCIETYTKVDMRTVSFDVPPQEVLTKDSVTVAVDAVVYYRVFNPVISIANVENAQESTRLLAQTSLRNVLGTNSLSEILSNREAVSICMREILDDATDHWGIKVERVEIKDVRLPIQLQRAMAAEAEAAREARAKVIAADGEHRASRSLRDAADVLSESSSAIQLRYLQTLNNIAGEKNSTIIFPLPIEIFSGFLRNTDNKGKKNLQNLNQNETINNRENIKSTQKPTVICSTDITDL